MLGWEVYVFRSVEAKRENLVVRWQTGVFGLDWLDDLVKQGHAADLGGNGYPSKYTVVAHLLFSTISNGLPVNNSPLVIGDDYVLPEGWNGEIVWAQKQSSCNPSDTLFLEVWDQS